MLVPRAESETMIQGVIETFPDRTRPLRVLDLGIGSGCLLLTVLHLYVNARGLGIDASEKALTYARANAEALGVDARLELRRADWRDSLAGTFDIVLTNPPYIHPTRSTDWRRRSRVTSRGRRSTEERTVSMPTVPFYP